MKLGVPLPPGAVLLPFSIPLSEFWQLKQESVYPGLRKETQWFQFPYRNSGGSDWFSEDGGVTWTEQFQFPSRNSGSSELTRSLRTGNPAALSHAHGRFVPHTGIEGEIGKSVQDRIPFFGAVGSIHDAIGHPAHKP